MTVCTVQSQTMADLSAVSEEDLAIAAQNDAQQYFASYRQSIIKAHTLEIGTVLALRHHLVGSMAHTYTYTFFNTLDALIDYGG